MNIKSKSMCRSLRLLQKEIEKAAAERFALANIAKNNAIALIGSNVWHKIETEQFTAIVSHTSQTNGPIMIIQVNGIKNEIDI